MKFFAKLTIILFLISLSAAALAADISPPEPDASQKTSTEPEKVLAATARNALVYDTVSDQFLFEKDIHDRVPIASITKIMTTLLVLEHGGFDEMVTANESALFDITSDSSTQNIVAGETMSVMDLLYCVMVASANEACNILAEHVSGSVDEFINLMNARAAELGCKDTHFANTHGLSNDSNYSADFHYSSAYDVLLVTKEAMKHPEFIELSNTTSKTIAPTNKTESTRSFYSTNHLISKHVQAGYLYYLAQGIKTGHTTLAGYCLVSSAVNEGMHLITVVLGAEKADNKVMSFVETKELMEWSFDNYSHRQILNSLDVIDKVGVELGKDYNEVYVVPQKSLTALTPKTLDVKDLERLITLPDSVAAPVTKGQQLGEITLAYKGHEYGTVPLIAGIAVERSQEESFVQDVQEFAGNPWLKYVIIGSLGIIVIYTVVVIIYNSNRRKNSSGSNYKGKKRRRKW